MLKNRDELFKNYVGASINYVNATCDLYEAKAALEDFDRDNAKNTSQSDVEPERESCLSIMQLTLYQAIEQLESYKLKTLMKLLKS